MTRRIAIALFAAALATVVSAQPPAETCGPGDSTTGADTLPFLGLQTPAADDLDLSGTGCTELGFDNVTCMTPASTCTVTATCQEAFNSQPEGLQVGINAVEGSCSTAPATCLDSDSNTGFGTITGLTMTGGTTYCFVCETGQPQVQLSLSIAATAGDCGSLPVDLQSVAVE